MAAEITGITKTLLPGNKTENSKVTSGNTITPKVPDSGHMKNIPDSSSPAPVDKVTLTRQAEELRMIEKAMNDQKESDNERIENLKLEIDAGRYDIDAQRVAEKLIKFEMLFVA